MKQLLTTWYLEQCAPRAPRQLQPPRPTFELRCAKTPQPAFSRFLYCAVGGDWHWRDRLSWTHARWLKHLNRPQVQTWVLYQEGSPAGYIELEQQAHGDVEIAYFGLLPEFTGQGLGGWLLDQGLAHAWQMGARRVWVHTCSLDAPAALATYQAAGMSLYREVQQEIKAPGPAQGPWPGAYAADAADT